MSEPQSARGFIVGRLPFGNTSLILKVLSKTDGRLTLMAKGATRQKSPFAGQIDLFYLAEFLYQPARSGEMHNVREIKLVEAHLGLRRSYLNMMTAQYFAALIEAITEASTPVPEEFDLFSKAMGYLIENESTWRAVERFEQRILALSGLGQKESDLPRAFQALHHKVPALRDDLLKLLAKAR